MIKHLAIHKKCKYLLILMSLALVLTSCGEYTEEQREQFYSYKNNTLDVLVPIECSESIKSHLDELKTTANLDYEYRKFIGLRDAYNKIDGYVALKTTKKYLMDDLYNFKIKLTENCYADTSISIDRINNYWNEVGKQLKYLEDRNIKIHSINLTNEKVKIFVNMAEYRSHKNTPVPTIQ